jgi:hypothetical protein
MHEDEPAAAKDRITDVKQRLQQIYTESFSDINRSKVFEYEFSLYLKACADAREERIAHLKLQHSTTRIGLATLLAAAGLVLYFFSGHVLVCTFLLLAAGFFSCGFMYMLLAGETGVLRTGRYCFDLERFFKRHRWSGEEHEKLHLPTMPLWEEYRAAWDGDVFDERPYGRTALYAPLRIAITALDMLALAFLLYTYVTGPAEKSAAVYVAACAVWAAAVIAQMLFVHAIINKIGFALESAEKSGAERPEELVLGPGAATVGTIVKLFFLSDLIAPQVAPFPGRIRSGDRPL